MATIINITPKTFVKVTKHTNGYYTQLIYNDGLNGGEIHIFKTEKAALKKAKQIKDNY
jgi:hypothetical protein